MLPLRDPEEAVVAVDLGGTKTAAAVVARDGTLRTDVLEVPTPAHDGPDAVLDAVAGLVGRVVATSGAGAPAAVGIGSAGVIDPGRGVVVSATDAITCWTGTGVSDGVFARLARRGLTAADGSPLLVTVDNDVNAYVAGEAWLGAGRGASTALVVAVGTGVGGALVLGGAVHHGAHFLAGEMGHMPSAEAGRERCTCSRPGHLEAVAAGPQIARRYRESTGRADVVTALEVERLADGGEPVAARVYDAAARALGRAVAQVVTVVDPEVVVISGGLARSGERWWGRLRSTVRDELVDLVADVPVVPAELGTRAPLVGAARQALVAVGLLT
ncbi:ROK family protein [Actinomyces radicidentis]|uniref:ROK family protein n=1 Tax=Actinomyces radicidentis TaxID=111015 RepID=UPI0028E1D934|nr:ROK family protein [Actinomyces radicidentis]